MAAGLRGGRGRGGCGAAASAALRPRPRRAAAAVRGTAASWGRAATALLGPLRLAVAAAAAAQGDHAAPPASPEGWVGLGDTGEAYVEDGVDKSPVRGPGLSKGLGDDESFKPPDFADALYADPGCEGAGPKWAEYRQRMGIRYETVEEDEDMKAAAAMNFLWESGIKEFKKMDKEANKCFLGVCATLYHLARHRMLVEGNYQSAAVLMKSLDRFVASVHPQKFDDANLVGSGSPLWPISDALIGRLMRDIAMASKGRGHDYNCGSEKGCIKGAKPMHGNIFHAFANDTLPLLPGEQRQPVAIADAFKIYVYDVDAYEELAPLTSGTGFCKDNQWGFEVLLHLYFLACDCRTDDPEEADFFFVPQYTACHLNVNTFTEEESNDLFKRLVPRLQWFNRTSGRDHIFIWGAGFAVDGPFRDWEHYIKDSIFLMTETEYWNPYKWQTKKNFHFHKDIVLPGKITVKEVTQHDKLSVPMHQREYTGDFVGWNRPLHSAQGTAESPRQRLLKWAAKYPDMHIRQDVPYSEALVGSVNSKFCFVPRGKSAWSSRLFRTMYGRCVPVILNDDYELPFLSLFKSADNWFIRWPMREVTDDFARLLQEFDVAALEQMVENAAEPKCWYFWPPPTIDASHYDLQEEELDKVCPEWRTKNAFVAVLTLLLQKKRVTKSALKTFYVPGGSSGRHMTFNDRDSVLM